jgi:hypothetical protein
VTGQDLLYYDDIYIKSNDLTDHSGPTVIALAHNEMYFIPAWLNHYRTLGAERFIVLDDASTDDTLNYLSKQPDVMVVGSRRRYGETVPVIDRSDPTGQTVKMRRMGHLWKMILPEKYAMDRWVVQTDLDEFLVLPEGQDLGSVFAQFATADFDAVTGTMLDVYPEKIDVLRDQMTQSSVNLADDWYYDARPHSRPFSGTFREIYGGSRSRLEYEFLPRPRVPIWRRLRLLARRIIRGTGPYPHVNETRKYSLVRWRPGTWMRNAHLINLRSSPSHHLPILHMKFTGDLYRRAQVAIRDKSYSKGSAGYLRLAALLAEMERRQASFLCPWSASIHDRAAFKAQLILGFDESDART